jgi:hypothetical protein
VTLEGRAIPGWVNPLQFLEVDEPWATAMKAKPDLEAAIRFLCAPGVPTDLESILTRYREIGTETTRPRISEVFASA